MKYICKICGYVYDDDREKVPFDELPADWTCPLCGAPKELFAPQEPASEAPAAAVPPAGPEPELQQLSAGQLAAVCSNFVKGCERQYKGPEAEAYKRLAEYFTRLKPAVPDPTVSKVLDALKQEVEEYAPLTAVSREGGDRGARRICVWGEKVSRMLGSLVERYLRQGDSMLADTEIWVCTACGFVYIGEQAPERCPVCKVPAWKFEKIEGRK